MTVRCLTAAIITLSISSLGSTERLSMRVSPSVSFAPANLIVQATVTANGANRWIEVTAESDQFYRSSEMPLDGDRAPRISRFEFKSLPSGEYAVRVVLKGTSGNELAVVQSHVNVVESGTVVR